MSRPAVLSSCLLVCAITTGCGPALTVGAAIGLGSLQDDGDGPMDAPPAASVTTPAGVVNDVVPVAYRLTDPDANDRASVQVEFSANGGATWAPAAQSFSDGAEGTQGLTTSASGVDHVFLWSSPADLGFADVPGVLVRVTPTDATTAQAGQAVVTSPFTVRNRFLTTLAGRPTVAGVQGVGVAVAPDGDLVLADTGGHRVVRLDRTSGLTTIPAGTGQGGDSGEAILGSTARLNGPLSIAVLASDSDVLVADTFNGLVRRIDDASGFLTQDIVGRGEQTGDGALAHDSSILPRDVALERSGNPFLLTGNKVRFVNMQNTSSVTFPTGTTQVGGAAQSIALQPGVIASVYATFPDPLGNNPSAFRADVLQRPAAIAVHDDAGTGDRLLYILELGPVGPRSAAFPRILCVNYGVAPVTLRQLDGPLVNVVTIPRGEVRLVARGTTVVPDLRDLADIALFRRDVLLLTTGFDHKLYAINLSATPTSVLGTSCPAGSVTRVAGTGTGGVAGDGRSALQTELIGPFGVAVQGGHVVLTESNARLRVLADPGQDFVLGAQTVTRGTTGTLAVIPPGTLPAVVSPLSVVRDGEDLLVCDVALGDPRSSRILRVRALDGGVSAVVGNGVFGDLGDGGPAVQARLGVAFEPTPTPDGAVLFADLLHERVRAVNTGAAPITILGVTIAPGAVATIVGTGVASVSSSIGDGGPPGQATLRRPSVVKTDARGLLWISDTGDLRIRVVNPGATAVDVAGVTIAPGTIASVVGTGALGTPADDGDGGPARLCKLDSPSALFGPDGNLWVLDGIPDTGTRTPRVRLVNLGAAPITACGVTIAPGAIDTVIGSGAPRLVGDGNLGDGGPATSATFRTFGGLSARRDGLVFVSDPDDHRVRVVNTTAAAITLGGRAIAAGSIETAIGSGLPGFDGDPSRVGAGFSGVTTAGLVDRPQGVLALDDGRVLLCDLDNGCVRLANFGAGALGFSGISASPGQMVVVAGSRSGKTRCQTPVDVEVDPDGTVVWSDQGELEDAPALLRLDPRTRVVTRLAGTLQRTRPDGSDLGDGGPALLATFTEPSGLARDVDGSLFVADAGARRVRFINRSTAARAPLTGGVTAQPASIITVVDGSTGDGNFANDDGRLVVGDPALDLRAPSDVDLAQGGVLWIADPGLGSLFRVNTTTGRVQGVLRQTQLRGNSNTGQVPVATAASTTFTDPAANFGLAPQVAAGDLILISASSGTLVVEGVVATLPVEARIELINAGNSVRLDRSLGMQGAAGTVSYTVQRRENPTAVAAIDASSAYVAFETPNAIGATRIRRVSFASGAFTVTQIAGNGAVTWQGDAVVALGVGLADVPSLRLDGNLLFACDAGLHRLLAINTGGSSATVAGLAIAPGDARTISGGGRGEAGFNGDGLPPEVATLNGPSGVALTPDGGVVVADQQNGRLRRFQR